MVDESGAIVRPVFMGGLFAISKDDDSDEHRAASRLEEFLGGGVSGVTEFGMVGHNPAMRHEPGVKLRASMRIASGEDDVESEDQFAVELWDDEPISFCFKKRFSKALRC